MNSDFIEIPSANGLLKATLFTTQDCNSVLVIASATGVKQEFYKTFATYVQAQGIAVITFDYSGIGRSLSLPLQQVKSNAASWGYRDLEAVFQFVLQKYPKAKKMVLGHSIGGQLIGLAPSSIQFDKIILVASQSGYWKFWSGKSKIQMWFNWYVLFPVLLPLFGYLPSKKLTGMENLPKNMAAQWMRWCRSENYLWDDPSIEEKYYSTIENPVSVFANEDDHFAPKTAVLWLAKKYENAKLKEYELKLKDFQTKRIGHFGVFKASFESSIWQLLLREMA